MTPLFQQKIKGTTLLEVLIVMAVSLIVIATAAKTSELIFKEIDVVRKTSNASQESFQFHYILYRDVLKAKAILKESNENFTIQHDSVWVKYETLKDKILRKTKIKTDTFHIVKTSLELKELEGYEAIHLIGFIQLNAKILDEEENFVFEKEYSTETLLNLMPEEKP